MDHINHEIGKRIRRIREQRNLSLDQTSELTDVSKGMLSKIENGLSSPTISVLWKIASGLNIAFSYFLDEDNEEITVIRKNKTKPIVDETDDMTAIPLFSYDDSRRFEVFYIELKPNCHHVSTPHRANVEEYILANRNIAIEVSGQIIELGKGDAVRYLANNEHTYINKSDETVSFHHIIYYHK